MILIDTSVWISTYRDASGRLARRVGEVVGDEQVGTTDCIICELLQGTSSEQEWTSVLIAMRRLELLSLSADDWIDAARIYWELQRRGITVRSTIDCCIAQLALRNQATLLHIDQDFERIAAVRPLKILRLDTVQS